MISASDSALTYWTRQAYQLGTMLKQATDPQPAYNLSGLLYMGSRGYVLLSVPNALVRGIFDAMHEPGAELPLDSEGRLNAHISVFRSEELEGLGGPDALKNDRGKPFRYSIGRLVEIIPTTWEGVAKVWAVVVHSPELQQLRRSYGLSGIPNDGKFQFHITCAVLKRGVLGRTEKSKNTASA